MRCQIDIPYEFTNTHLRRQVIKFMCTHHNFFYNHTKEIIRDLYGGGGTKGPFSFVGFLKYVLKRSSWADEIIINALSIMLQLPMTIIFTEDLRQLKIRHTRKNLKEVEIVLLYAKGMHYSAAGKGHNYVLWVTTMVR